MRPRRCSRRRHDRLPLLRACFGVDVTLEARVLIVGRKREVDWLREALATATEERSPQLVPLVGVPGIGKSRLVYELMSVVEQSGTLTYWRQGRSLPYGEGVTFWALAEMVKAQAGILETDSEDEAESKLETAVGDLQLDAADRQWVARHLRPLLGLSSDGGAGTNRASRRRRPRPRPERVRVRSRLLPGGARALSGGR